MKKYIKKAIGIKKLKSEGLKYKEIGDKINLWKMVNCRESMPIKKEKEFSVKDLLKSPVPFIEKYSEKSSIFKKLILFIKRLFKIRKNEKTL